MQEFDSFLKFPFESFQTFFPENFSNVCNNFYKDRPPDINKLHISMCNFQIFLIKFVKTNKKNYTIQVNIIKKLSLSTMTYIKFKNQENYTIVTKNIKIKIQSRTKESSNY